LDDIVVKYLFKRIVIKTDQVQTIHLSQKSDYQFLFIGMQMDSTIIELKNDKKLIFWDFMYEDFGRVKRALDLSIKPDKLERLNALRREKAKVTPINREDLSTENFVALKGNGIFNFYGILLVGMLGVFIMGIDRENYLRSIFGYIFIVFGVGFHLNYFRISENYFQVKNHVWFWKTFTYRLDDILEIIHEHPMRSPESIRIRLKNFHTSGLQQAGSFTEKHWIDLKERLDKLNIPFQSEYYLNNKQQDLNSTIDNK
jgi:hypothetical protein